MSSIFVCLLFFKHKEHKTAPGKNILNPREVFVCANTTETFSYNCVAIRLQVENELTIRKGTFSNSVNNVFTSLVRYGSV